MKDERGAWQGVGIDIDVNRLHEALVNSWSKHTSSLWTLENPARGQCSVTACVVQQLYGGDILKTPAPDGWHFYNHLSEVRCDFTASQFATPIEYQDIPSSFEQALSDTTVEQCNHLRQRILTMLGSTGYKFLNLEVDT